MSEESEQTRLRTLVRTDAFLVLASMAFIYLVFAVVGSLLNYNIGGMLSLMQQVTFFTGVYALVVLALNLHWGYAGLFNIGVAGYMAVGVYTWAMLSTPSSASPPRLGLPLPIGILGGMLAAAFVGFLTALPALRLRADYLAITTVAISEIIRFTYKSRAFSTFAVPGTGTTLGTGGAGGFNTLPTNPVRGLYYTKPDELVSEPTAFGNAVFGAMEGIGVFREKVVVDLTYAIVLGVIVLLAYLLLARVGNSPYGRVLKAIREDETVAKSLGKDTNLFKIKTFMLGCALMGLAGILWQGSISGVYPANFKPTLTFYIFIALIIGGAGSNTGSVLGGALFVNLLFLLPQLLPNIIQQFVTIQSNPSTFISAVTPIAAGEITPLIGFMMNQRLSALRFVFVGILLVYLMQNRPDGLLGHRKETAATVPLTEGSRPGTRSGGDDDE
jgi:branched-chain amino acid transport system permease protein